MPLIITSLIGHMVEDEDSTGFQTIDDFINYLIPDMPQEEDGRSAGTTVNIGKFIMKYSVKGKKPGKADITVFITMIIFSIILDIWATQGAPWSRLALYTFLILVIFEAKALVNVGTSKIEQFEELSKKQKIMSLVYQGLMWVSIAMLGISIGVCIAYYNVFPPPS